MEREFAERVDRMENEKSGMEQAFEEKSKGWIS